MKNIQLYILFILVSVFIFFFGYRLASQEQTANDPSPVFTEVHDSANEMDSDTKSQVVDEHFQIEENTVTSDDLTLEVPEQYSVRFIGTNVDGTKIVRIQNYDVMLDYKSPGEFYLYLNYEEDFPNFSEYYASTELTQYLGKEVIQADGVGPKSLSTAGSLTRAYFFTDTNLVITIYPHDQSGLNAAEELLSVIEWAE